MVKARDRRVLSEESITKSMSKLFAYYAGTAGEIQRMGFIEFVVTVQSNSAVLNSYPKSRRLVVKHE